SGRELSATVSGVVPQAVDGDATGTTKRWSATPVGTGSEPSCASPPSTPATSGSSSAETPGNQTFLKTEPREYPLAKADWEAVGTAPAGFCPGGSATRTDQ